MNKDKLKKLIYDMESENKEVRYKMFEFIKSFSDELANLWGNKAVNTVFF